MGTSGMTVTGRAFAGGRPRGRRTTAIRPRSSSSPPHTPHGSSLSIAPCKHWALSLHREQIALAR